MKVHFFSYLKEGYKLFQFLRSLFIKRRSRWYWTDEINEYVIVSLWTGGARDSEGKGRKIGAGAESFETR